MLSARRADRFWSTVLTAGIEHLRLHRLQNCFWIHSIERSVGLKYWYSVSGLNMDINFLKGVSTLLQSTTRTKDVPSFYNGSIVCISYWNSSPLPLNSTSSSSWVFSFPTPLKKSFQKQISPAETCVLLCRSNLWYMFTPVSSEHSSATTWVNECCMELNREASASGGFCRNQVPYCSILTTKSKQGWGMLYFLLKLISCSTRSLWVRQSDLRTSEYGDQCMWMESVLWRRCESILSSNTGPVSAAGLVAQWITRRFTEPKIAGSIPAEVAFSSLFFSIRSRHDYHFSQPNDRQVALNE